jgi:hypothetical protein
MSKEQFKKAYGDSNIKSLRKFIKRSKVLSTKKFVSYIEKSFVRNREVYDVLVLILFNQYDLNKAVKNMIKRDNIDLLENVLNNNVGIELDENLILNTVPKGRVSMAKAIYEYIHGGKDDYEVIAKLLDVHEFVYDEDKHSIDSFVLALYNSYDEDAELIIPYINPGFWNDFAIKYIMIKRPGCMDNVMKILLSHNMVDPGVDDNFILKSILRGDPFVYRIMNELLKHPLVAIEGIDLEFVKYLINDNYLCVVERLLRSGNNEIILLFKISEIIELMCKCHNDVTYLAIKLGIMSIKKLCEVKFFYGEREKNAVKYLNNFKIDAHYVMKSYELQLDPEQIYEKALKNNDIRLIKSITNYPISIKVKWLFEHLLNDSEDASEDGDNDGETAYDYIWNNVMKQYNPNELLITAGKYNNDYDGIVDDVLEVIEESELVLDYKYVGEMTGNAYLKKIMWEEIKTKYNADKCEKFIIKTTCMYLDLDDEELDELTEESKISKLDEIFDEYIRWIY